MNTIPDIVTSAGDLLTSIYPIIVTGVMLWVMLVLAKIVAKEPKSSYHKDMDRLEAADGGRYGANRKSYRRQIQKRRNNW